MFLMMAVKYRVCSQDMVVGICSTLVLCTILWWDAKEITLNKTKAIMHIHRLCKFLKFMICYYLFYVL